VTLVAEGLAVKDPRDWKRFERKFRKEMSQGDAPKVLDLLAALSHQTNLSIGCYCEHESSCHRSVLRALLQERAAKLV
jgi:uncharacterized protein YeaO (DUF488 family)